MVLFNANYGQHMAIMAGFERVRGERVVTLDADLQNPPEEIAQAAGRRWTRATTTSAASAAQRQDAWWRRVASRAMNRLRERITRIQMTDQGCMLRAYSRDIVDADQRRAARSTPSSRRSPTPSRSNPAEIEVAHEERAAGESKYSLYKLIRLNFDLITGFSLVPLQLFSLFGMLVAAVSLVAVRRSSSIARLVIGDAEGLSTLWDRDILAFFLIGIALFGLGLLGEYVGRIYQQVRDRPRYPIRAVLEQRPATKRARVRRRAGTASTRR